MSKKELGLNPWLTIWTRPRETIRKIVSVNPKMRFIILSFLYGFPMMLHIGQNASLGEQFNVPTIVVGALILSVFVGMLGITIASALLTWTGHWIGGQGKYMSVRAAVSWSNVPNIVSVLIWLGIITYFGVDVFTEEFIESPQLGAGGMILTTGLFLQAVISVWSFIILVKGLGEVHGFSAWRGVLNVLIPFFLVGAIIWVISWLFWMGNGMPQG